MSRLELEPVGIDTLKATSEIKTLDAGFLSASLENQGDASATITQGGKSFTLTAGKSFNFPERGGNLTWKALTIDASTTTVECVYYL